MELNKPWKDGGKRSRGVASRRPGGVGGGHAYLFVFFCFLIFENYLRFKEKGGAGRITV